MIIWIIYICYKIICISSEFLIPSLSSSSCHADCTDFHDSVSLSLSFHPFQSFIAPVRSTKLHPVSTKR